MEAVNVVGKKLKEFKEKHGLSSAALAKMLGISEAFMSQILSGKRIGRRKVLDFAERLGIPAEALIGKEPEGIPVRGGLVTGGLVEPAHKPETVRLPSFAPNSIYAIRVKKSCPPYYRAGDTIFVKKSTIIRDGDKIVLEAGLAEKVYIVAMIDQNLIVLNDLSGRVRVMERKLDEYDRVVCHISI